MQKNDEKQSNFENFSKKGQEEFENSVKEKLQKFQGYSQNQLVSELLSEAAKQKKQGNLDDKKLAEISQTILPFLDEEQQKKFNSLIDLLR